MRAVCLLHLCACADDAVDGCLDNTQILGSLQVFGDALLVGIIDCRPVSSLYMLGI